MTGRALEASVCHVGTAGDIHRARARRGFRRKTSAVETISVTCALHLFFTNGICGIVSLVVSLNIALDEVLGEYTVTGREIKNRVEARQPLKLEAV